MATSNASEICKIYGYPPEVEELLKDMCSLAQENLPGLHSILLSGSAATGDLVFRYEDNRLVLLSDLDLVAYCENPASAAGRFVPELNALERRYRNPLFHIDLAISPMSGLKRIQSSYQMVELKRSPSLLYGQDVRNYFPDEFERKRSLSSFFGNLWKAILYWPDSGAHREEFFRFVLARLILDIPLLVFSEQGKLICGHSARAKEFCDLNADTHPLVSDLTKNAVRMASATRQRGSAPPAQLQEVFFEVLDAVLQYFGFSETSGLEDRVRIIRKQLVERSPRRIAGEVLSGIKNIDNLVHGLVWSFRRKEAWAGVAVIEMLELLRSKKFHERDRLDRVELCLSKFCGTEVVLSGTSSSIAEFRSYYWLGFKRLFPSVGKNEDFVMLAGEKFSF